jgi:hypothetical protein
VRRRLDSFKEREPKARETTIKKNKKERRLPPLPPLAAIFSAAASA